MDGQQFIRGAAVALALYAIVKGLHDGEPSSNSRKPDSRNSGKRTPTSNTPDAMELLRWHVEESTTLSGSSQGPNPGGKHERIDITALAADLAELFGLAPATRDKAVAASPGTLAAKHAPDTQVLETGKWLSLVRHPSIILILGKRGSGKSALGYRLLEFFRYALTPYVVGLPAETRKLLPSWIGMAPSLEDAPPKSIALVDEAYVPFHARSSMAAEARAMSQLLNLSRQRRQTIIFVTQEARQVDRNIASSANVVVFKEPGMLQFEFDRPELKQLAASAKEAFVAVSRESKRWSYVYSPDADFVGLVENSLSSFWTERLSHVFATGGGPFVGRAPKKTALQDRIERAKELHRQGLSQGQIAKMLGVTRPTVKNYLEGYPYKR